MDNDNMELLGPAKLKGVLGCTWPFVLGLRSLPLIKSSYKSGFFLFHLYLMVPASERNIFIVRHLKDAWPVWMGPGQRFLAQAALPGPGSAPRCPILRAWGLDGCLASKFPARFPHKQAQCGAVGPIILGQLDLDISLQEAP